jgi:hypothetical protein
MNRVPDQKANVTTVPRYGIRITANLDAGATGRNGLLSVTVDDKTYEEMMWAEPGNDFSSDFPVFIPVTKSERRVFLRIQPEHDRVVVDECPVES